MKEPILSRPQTKEYRAGYDQINWGKKKSIIGRYTHLLEKGGFAFAIDFSKSKKKKK